MKRRVYDRQFKIKAHLLGSWLMHSHGVEMHTSQGYLPENVSHGNE